jgi:two-component system, OmpR family, phosphate regulon sensor histidine kinase PhoR
MKPTPSSTQEHCTVEHLATVFGQYRNEILDEWRLHTNQLLSALQLDRATLTNHVPDIVDEIIWDLSYRREGSPPKEDKRGSHPRHGVQRVTDGLNIGQVVAEYNLLRDAFFTVADHHDLYLVGEAARIISHRIDDGVRAAVTAFAAQQARNLKAREEEHLAFIAHDLRTPINAIGLLTEELKMARDENALADADETFELLKRNLERLSNQIKRVLEGHSKGPETEKTFRPQCRTFELWPLVQALILDFRSIAAKDGIQVVNQTPRLLTVWADAGLISLALQNLLGNAFKHTANGKVVISASAEAGNVICRVEDNGAGIPAEMLTKVFDKHVTGSEQPGTGLGLAIVKQIVEAHGGLVSVESNPGVGTSFSFTVPMQPES